MNLNYRPAVFLHCWLFLRSSYFYNCCFIFHGITVIFLPSLFICTSFNSSAFKNFEKAAHSLKRFLRNLLLLFCLQNLHLHRTIFQPDASTHGYPYYQMRRVLLSMPSPETDRYFFPTAIPAGVILACCPGRKHLHGICLSDFHGAFQQRCLNLRLLLVSIDIKMCSQHIYFGSAGFSGSKSNHYLERLFHVFGHFKIGLSGYLHFSFIACKINGETNGRTCIQPNLCTIR